MCMLQYKNLGNKFHNLNNKMYFDLAKANMLSNRECLLIQFCLK